MFTKPSPEEEQLLIKKFKDLELENRESTLEEFKTIVVPYLHYRNNYLFNLKTEKQKEAEAAKEERAKIKAEKDLEKAEKLRLKEEKKKEPKVKKLTKKERGKLMQELYIKRCRKEELTEEENTMLDEFLNEAV